MAGDASRKNGLLGGRPTSLTKEVVEKAEAYVEKCFEGLEPIIVKQGYGKDGNVSWEQTAPMLPNMARLALTVKVHKKNIYEWIKIENWKKDTEKLRALRLRFRDTVNCINEIHEAVLEEQGAAGRINPIFAKFLMNVRHGLTEKRELKAEITVNEVKGFKFADDEIEED